jgi:UTP--glucose-1-phosphate uridylyltransferase
MDLLEKHGRSGSAALCIRPVPIETTNRFGIVECDGDRVERLVEKPIRGTSASNLAIFGRYLVTEAVIAGLRDLSPSGEVELTYGFAAALATPAGVRAVTFSGRSYDCGTPSEYALSIAAFMESSVDSPPAP